MNGLAPPVLAVGAARPFAGLVVPALAAQGAKVRGRVRNASEGGSVRAHGAAEIAVGDLRDRLSLDAALSGVDALFYIAPAFQDDEVEFGLRMADAAKEAGISRIAFSSVIHRTLSAPANHAAKSPMGEAILASDMEYVFLYPAIFFQNLARSWPRVAATGVFSEPWSAKTRFSGVDYRDVAEVAALALTSDRMTFGTFELCAEGDCHRGDLAAPMAAALGSPVSARVSDASKAPAAMRPKLDRYDRHGLLGHCLVLAALLGREPRSLASYFKEPAARAPPLN